tara:strand:- start:13153 stop:14634 length:1482 start_codon:yes stop_codon:yes gene_type:complete
MHSALAFKFLPSFLKGVLVFLLMCSSAFASPWISVGETRLKQNLHLLNDTGVISMSLTTWPIMWSDVQSALVKVDDSQLNKAQLMAIKELKFEMRFQTKKEMKRSLELAASSSRTAFRDFSAQEYEKGRISHIFDWDGEDLSFKLQANLTTDPGDDAVESQLYGSYVAGVVGNWVLGVGAIDRWWGASSQSSLILGNNSRPVSGVFFRTKGAQYFETPWLSWLGDWQFVSFIGQLESNRFIPESKLTGMRFTFQPFDNLELGLSRAMQWGGEGRSESFSTFLKSLTSQGENTSEQSGNQLAGYDLRYNFLRKPSYGATFYAQLIGEDEAGYLPSKFISQAGLEYNLALSSGNSLNLFIEHTNTIAGSIGGKQFNTAYDHSVYKTGYRYRGRSIGATYDNDAKIYSGGFSYQFVDLAQKVSSVISRIELNTDGSAGGNAVSSSVLDLYSIDLSYQRLLFQGKLDIRASYLTELPDLLIDDIDKFNLGIAWTYRF